MEPTVVDSRASIARLHPSLALRARLGIPRTFSWPATCFVLDAVMLVLAVVGTEVGTRLSGAAAVPAAATAGFLALSFVLVHSSGMYVPRLYLDTLEDVKTVAVQVTIAAMIVLSVVAAAESAQGTLGGDAIFGIVRLWAFAVVYVSAGRAALNWSQTQARRRGDIVTPTLVVGTGPVGRRIARRLIQHRDLGLLPVGFAQPNAEPEASRDPELPVPVLGSTDELDRLVRDYDIAQVVVNCAGGVLDDDLLPLLAQCERAHVAVAFVPAAHERVTSNLRVEHVGGLPLITSYATNPRGWQFAVKYAIDRVVAAFLLLMVSPIFVAAAAAVFVSMGRPIFFRQVRIGRDGEEFEILKFRSMKEGAAGAAAGFVVADGLGPGGVEGDDRRTRVGTFLRKSSIDELPQLLNVLKGDMSLVGPRPERPEYVDQFRRTVYRYGERHRVKSGITGWAQVHGLRGKTSIEDRAEWDNYYIENFSLWLDLKILLLTAIAVFRVFKSVE